MGRLPHEWGAVRAVRHVKKRVTDMSVNDSVFLFGIRFCVLGTLQMPLTSFDCFARPFFLIGFWWFSSDEYTLYRYGERLGSPWAERVGIGPPEGSRCCVRRSLFV